MVIAAKSTRVWEFYDEHHVFRLVFGKRQITRREATHPCLEMSYSRNGTQRLPVFPNFASSCRG